MSSMPSRQIVFTGKDAVALVEQPVPQSGPGEALVQATTSLISTGTETICLGRRFEPGSHWERWMDAVGYPFSPGYSLMGRIVALGPAAPGPGQEGERGGPRLRGIREGDRVALRRPHRQYVAAPLEALFPVPDAVSDEEASWFALATITQNGVRRAGHVLGEDVAVVGLGPLGQLVTQYMRLLGARQVIAIDPVERRLALARGHGRGATATLPLGVAEAREAVLGLTEGQGVHVVYDVTGAAPVFSAALGLLRRFGRLVLLGDTGMPSAQHLTGDVVTKGLTVIGAHDSNPPPTSTDHAYWSARRMAELFFTYLARGDLRVSDLITDRYDPREAAEAYRLLQERRAETMGVLFDWTRL